MTAAGFSGPVALTQTGDVTWTLDRDLSYTSVAGVTYTAPAESPTDGASVPRPVAWLVPRSGRYLPAAVVHDHAYRVTIPSGRQTYREADQVLLEGMRLLGVPFCVRWLIFVAVRAAGLFRRGGLAGGWWRDAPAVLLCLLLAVPIVVPVSAAVVLGLAELQGAEVVAWCVLRVAGRRDHVVNPPDVSARA